MTDSLINHPPTSEASVDWPVYLALKDELRAVAENAARLRAENTGLRHQLAGTQTEVEVLRQEVAQLQDRYDGLVSRMISFAKELAK